jgi:Domain of Unknown Function (DUF1080)
MEKAWMVGVWPVQVTLYLLNMTNHCDQKVEWDYYGILKKKYKDFVLKIDWKVSRRNDNSGVFVRFLDPDNDPMIAVNTGYEIQIDDMALPNGNPLHKTGAIYNFAAPLNLRSKRVGQWNTFEIEVTGQKYSVILNGKKVIPEFTGNRNVEGYIGIQNHDADSHVSFKNIMIREKRQ